ncbi:hypothetical protein [Mesorhizobium sp.]|uniref:hypothetical protein n=1 Tax=Mesorhizobium sp. TaxID=1871066 RepID=UPI000FE48CEF|nr:hypothetical protein [Mesorhizobium sp.]RWA59453.1 MAG: hypothetical protein EOQ27_26400 [Mesorhizobium sp.]
MNRREAVLAMLASANGAYFSPVQLQKAMFLVEKNTPDVIDEGAHFAFVPYDYGPFDVNVYNEASALRATGDVMTTQAPGGRWSYYSATDHGWRRGQAHLNTLPQHRRQYVVDVSTWVRSLTFSQLVKSIYDAYPEMRANSVFQG